MEIQFLGHSSFRIKGKKIIVVTDPYSKEVGFEMPRVSADIVTVSHEHFDHNAVDQVGGTVRRKEPFVIRAPGEYEVESVFVFGVASWHDKKKDGERGTNTIFAITFEGLRLVHLGDLGHKLADKQIEKVGEVDILMVPVGGNYTIGPKEAGEVVNQLEPLVVIPMHFQTKKYKKDFGLEATAGDFLEELGVEAEPQEKLVVSKESLPDEREVVWLKA